jgi:hypothetical protein
MPKLPDDLEPEPTLPNGMALQERLVTQTLKMNPDLAKGQNAREFIRRTTGSLAEAAKLAMEQTENSRSSEVKTLSRGLLMEHRKHKESVAEIDRHKRALEQQAAQARKETLMRVVVFLARNVKAVEDLKDALSENKVLWEELAVSPREVIEQVAALKRKQREEGG